MYMFIRMAAVAREWQWQQRQQQVSAESKLAAKGANDSSKNGHVPICSSGFLMLN